MNLEAFDQYCQDMPGAHLVIQWRGAHVWKIGEKVFAIGRPVRSSMSRFIFKVSEHHYLNLSDRPGFQPAPYFAARGFKWIQCFDTTECSSSELEYYLDDSYRRVVAGMTTAQRKAILE